MSDELAFLAHRKDDSVAVAVRDVEAGLGRLAFLNSDETLTLEAKEAIPLGHKVALEDIAEGSDIIEYGEVVGHSIAAIQAGSLVHVHNIRSNRWQVKS
ncbi:MAG: UxaA family hydrolase [Acidimicrobiaceae bacterium]|jgi:(2R)-sulfolactate sulfo-lyase subunit alpha|nr:UxaA family hydrolase [Acidimicrobiaceae bacterium]